MTTSRASETDRCCGMTSRKVRRERGVEVGDGGGGSSYKMVHVNIQAIFISEF